jgi:hypothetical protein
MGLENSGYVGYSGDVCAGMSVPKTGMYTEQNPFKDLNTSKKVVHYGPESVAHYRPEYSNNL